MVASTVASPAFSNVPSETLDWPIKPEIRRGNARTVQADAGGFDRRLRRFNACLGRTFRRYRSIVLLFTDGIGGNQRFVTRQIRIRFGKRCLCRCQLRTRAFQTCFISGTVNLIQRLSGTDITAFLEQAFLNDAANLRTDIGGTQRFQTPRQLDSQRNGLRMDGYDTDDGSRCFPTRRLPALCRFICFAAR